MKAKCATCGEQRNVVIRVETWGGCENMDGPPTNVEQFCSGSCQMAFNRVVMEDDGCRSWEELKRRTDHLLPLKRVG
jgi:hypothetical protein